MKYVVSIGSEKYSIDENELENIELKAMEKGKFHALYQGQSIDLRHNEQLVKKEGSFRFNGQEISYKIEDELDIMVAQMGLSAKENKVSNDILAPMPGLVLEVLVNEGQSVNKGDSIVILEAMKMENVLKATGDATIDSIMIANGDTVEKNQLLIKLQY